MPEAQLCVLRVFVAPDGRGGNPLGVFLDGELFAGHEQEVAADLGFSETVFVTDAPSARLRIFTPATELPLAGHPLVGTSWLLYEEGFEPDVLRPPPDEVPTWRDGDITWISARPEDAPEFNFVQFGDGAAVEALAGAPDGGDVTVAWAWVDESVGTVRARAFLPGLGVAEDEATGAAALRLCAQLGRPLAIHQGEASLLHVTPAEDGRVELGGRVAPVERRGYELPG
jgi:predicted PhzF superfamily epimerase YddE/YHI9